MGIPLAQRWVAAVSLHCETGFRSVEGCREIAAVVSNIEAEHAAGQQEQAAA